MVASRGHAVNDVQSWSQHSTCGKKAGEAVVVLSDAPHLERAPAATVDQLLLIGNNVDPELVVHTVLSSARTDRFHESTSWSSKHGGIACRDKYNGDEGQISSS